MSRLPALFQESLPLQSLRTYEAGRRLLTMSSEQKQKGFKETVQQRLLAPAFTTGSPARHLTPQLPP